jgi:hypothetical protein
MVSATVFLISIITIFLKIINLKDFNNFIYFFTVGILAIGISGIVSVFFVKIIDKNHIENTKKLRSSYEGWLKASSLTKTFGVIYNVVILIAAAWGGVIFVWFFFLFIGRFL